MNLSGRPPEQKKVKPPPNPAHKRAVKRMACCACGRPGPSHIHHCRDKPPFDEIGIYRWLPGAAETSADEDGIPLCPDCHQNGPNAYHRNRPGFHALYGYDYEMIEPTRAAVRANTTIDF